MTELIELRPIDESHYEELLHLFSLKQEVIEGYLVEEVLGWSMSRLIFWKDQLAGLIQLRKLDLANGYGLVGTWLLPYAQGTGVNQAAKLAMLTELFDEVPEIQRVYMSIEESNVRSIKAAKKLSYAKQIAPSQVPPELLSDQGDSLTGELVSGDSTSGEIAGREPIKFWFLIDREVFVAAAKGSQ